MINFTIGAFIFDVLIVLLAYGAGRMLKPRKPSRKELKQWAEKMSKDAEKKWDTKEEQVEPIKYWEEF